MKRVGVSVFYLPFESKQIPERCDTLQTCYSFLLHTHVVTSTALILWKYKQEAVCVWAPFERVRATRNSGKKKTNRDTQVVGEGSRRRRHLPIIYLSGSKCPQLFSHLKAINTGVSLTTNTWPQHKLIFRERAKKIQLSRTKKYLCWNISFKWHVAWICTYKFYWHYQFFLSGKMRSVLLSVSERYIIYDPLKVHSCAAFFEKHQQRPNRCTKFYAVLSLPQYTCLRARLKNRIKNTHKYKSVVR